MVDGVKIEFYRMSILRRTFMHAMRSLWLKSKYGLAKYCMVRCLPRNSIVC